MTQRPAELDPTIISQCSTLFIMRVANDEDQTLLRSAVSDAAANLLSFVPSLGTGEVVGIGEGMPLPARLSFQQLPDGVVPRGESADQSGTDRRELSRGDLVRQAIERWRRATTSGTAREEEPPCEAAGAASIANGEDAIARGLRSIAVDRLPPQPKRIPLDPDRYTILKR